MTSEGDAENLQVSCLCSDQLNLVKTDGDNFMGTEGNQRLEDKWTETEPSSLWSTVQAALGSDDDGSAVSFPVHNHSYS